MEGQCLWGFRPWVGLRRLKKRGECCVFCLHFLTLDTAFYGNLVVTNNDTSFFILISRPLLPRLATSYFFCSLPQIAQLKLFFSLWG